MPSASLIKEFEQLVGKENVFSSEADRQSYAYDAAVLKPMIPSLVVRPTEVEQLGQVVKRCYEEGIPMTVRGSGTNLTGGTIPDCSDTIVILTTGLNKILEINTEDLYATVQPGVITAKFAAAAGDTALPAPMRAEARFAAGRLYAQQKQLDRAIALLSAAGSPEDMRSVTATWDEFSASLLRAINAGEYGPLKPAEPKL